MNSFYPWTRYWFEKGSKATVEATGYLADPEQPINKYFPPVNPHLVTTNALLDQVCLVLLGEPGTGKSYELELLLDESKKLDPEQHLVLRVDLKGRSDPADIRERIFKSSTFRRWLESTKQLHLFLDSLDECALRIEALGMMLAEDFRETFRSAVLPRQEYERLTGQEYEHLTEEALTLRRMLDSVTLEDQHLVHIDLSALRPEQVKSLPEHLRESLQSRELWRRLRLRLACRTADWESAFLSLQTTLANIWGQRELKAYEIAPLRRVDVALAADSEGLDLGVFLQTLESGSLVPLAVKPHRLTMLLKKFAAGKTLSSDLVDLYEQGFLLSCSETDPERRAYQRQYLDPVRRLEIASRIAAVTVLARRSSIYMGVDYGDGPPDRVSIADLTGYHETSKGHRFEIREAEIREALGTGLFRSAGEDSCLTLEHQSTAEYLAARYLKTHGLKPKQMLNAVLHPDDPEGRVTPQLRETALWLARMNEEILEHLLEIDPDLFLQTDLELSEAQRERLVARLLHLYETERLSPATFGKQARYAKLAHPKLAEQLRPYVNDPSRSENARWAAMEIARATDGQPLKDELLVVALDPNEDHHLRTVATSILADLDDDDVREAFRPLALGELPGDEDDELRGLALKAVWPKALTLQELFENLTPPKKRGLFGMYRSFVMGDRLWEGIKTKELPLALNWLQSSELWSWITDNSRFTGALDKFLVRAWDHMDEPGILDGLARILWREVDKHHHNLATEETSPLRDRLINDHAGRRKLLVWIIQTVMQDNDHVTWLYFTTSLPPLASYMDIDWMLQQLEAGHSEKVKARWAELIRRGFDHHNQEQYTRIMEVCQREPILAQAMAGVREARLEFERHEHQRARQEKTKALDPPPSERVKQCLERAEIDPSWWWTLARELTLAPEDTYYQRDFERDLTALPGWHEASEEVQGWIIQTAKAYVLTQEDHAKSWLGMDKIDFRAFAGYKALRLLLTFDRNFMESLSREVWERWAAAVLTYPNINVAADEDYGPDQELLRLTYTSAPDRCLELTSKIIDEEIQKHQYVFLTSRLKSVWDERLGDLLLDKVREYWQRGGVINGLLRELIERDFQPAHQLAIEWLKLTKRSSDTVRNRAVGAATALLGHAPDAGWQQVWPFLQQYPDLGREVALGIGDGRYTERGTVENRLSEDDVVDLYLWLEHHFPMAEDRKHEAGVARFVTPRDQVARWRNNIIGNLKERGTRAAVAALERILKHLPEHTWLNWTLREAREVTRRKTWRPLTPQQVIEMAARPEARLIRGLDQLLELVIESLERLDAAMQGETPVAPLLWNESSTGCYRPKDEDHLSDLVRWHLSTDLRGRGLNLNREPVIRRGEGKSKGERIDILVEVAVPNLGETLEQVGLIIEVKGCWNKEVNTALEQQLVERYLADNPARLGLYLVGWFMCPQWDKQDRRRTQTPKMTLGEARAFFDSQALKASEAGLKVRAFVLNTALR